MQITRMFWVAGFAVLCVGAAPARAGLWPRFQVDEAIVTCPSAAQVAGIEDTANSLPMGASFDPAVRADAALPNDAADFDVRTSPDCVPLADVLSLSAWDGWEGGALGFGRLGAPGMNPYPFFTDNLAAGRAADFRGLPAPTVVFLGMLGLGVAGVKLRKYA